MANTILTCAGLGYGATSVMNLLYEGFADLGTNTPYKIDYPAIPGCIPSSIDILDAGIENRMANTSDDLIVLGHSMGAQLAGEWLRIYGASKAAYASRLSFILCGNPSRRYGRPPWPANGVTNYTPDDTAFTVWDVCRLGDGWGNWPDADNPFNPEYWNLLGIAATLVGMFTIHLLYFGVDLTALETNKISSQTVGNTIYYLIP